MPAGQRVSSLLLWLVVLAAFAATAAASTRTFGTLSPIWYSNGILLVALLLRPLRRWPAYLLPAFAIDVFIYARWGQGSALVTAGADIIEVLVAAAIVIGTGGVRMPLYVGQQVLRVIGASLAAPLVSATIVTTALVGVNKTIWIYLWLNAYWGSALGLLIACPLLLSWADPLLRQQVVARLSLWSAVVLAGGALLAVYFTLDDESFIFLSFPILFGLAWAYGLLGATVGMLAVCLATLWDTMTGQGAITRISASPGLNEQIESVQVYLAAVLLSSLPLTILRSQQKVLVEDLRRAGSARTEFLAAMSHEIRTPITGVLGMAELLSEEKLSERQRGYVEAMRGSGRHLLSIINDVLDFSRIESGRLELDEVDFSLPQALEELRSMAHPLVVDRGLALAIELPGDTPAALRGDPLRLRQVLLNLVSNAIKFTEAGGVTLAVSHRPREDAPGCWLRFDVRDTGVGISPEKLQQLFAPFIQADRTIARQYGGSGLGLAISKRLVEAMGGSIGAESEVGVGSVFHFEVPFAPGEPRRVPSGPRTERREVPPQRILVAEDVEVNREILRTALERQGHRIAFAHHGGQALEMVQREPFDLVLMDVQMPGVDGVDATRRIRKLPPPLGGIPIIGLTANVMAHERERYLAAGMDDCLHKPIEWDRLHEAIAEYAGVGAPAAEAAPAPTSAPAAPTLIDEPALAGLRALAGDDLPELIRMGIKDYDRYCEAMGAPDVTPDVVRREAHKLKGSSGTLALTAVCALARTIEDAAEAGEPTADRIPVLREAIAASRAELARRGLV